MVAIQCDKFLMVVSIFSIKAYSGINILCVWGTLFFFCVECVVEPIPPSMPSPATPSSTSHLLTPSSKEAVSTSYLPEPSSSPSVYFQLSTSSSYTMEKSTSRLFPTTIPIYPASPSETPTPISELVVWLSVRGKKNAKQSINSASHWWIKSLSIVTTAPPCAMAFQKRS